jgi:hypothetical protein
MGTGRQVVNNDSQNVSEFFNSSDEEIDVINNVHILRSTFTDLKDSPK